MDGDTEDTRLVELQRQREKLEIAKLKADSGMISNREMTLAVESLEWMYDQNNETSRLEEQEAYKLGKLIPGADGAMKSSAVDDAAIGSLFLRSVTKTDSDTLRKIREDPLFAIQRAEIQHKQKLASIAAVGCLLKGNQRTIETKSLGKTKAPSDSIRRYDSPRRGNDDRRRYTKLSPERRERRPGKLRSRSGSDFDCESYYNKNIKRRPNESPQHSEIPEFDKRRTRKNEESPQHSGIPEFDKRRTRKNEESPQHSGIPEFDKRRTRKNEESPQHSGVPEFYQRRTRKNQESPQHSGIPEFDKRRTRKNEESPQHSGVPEFDKRRTRKNEEFSRKPTQEDLRDKRSYRYPTMNGNIKGAGAPVDYIQQSKKFDADMFGPPPEMLKNMNNAVSASAGDIDAAKSSNAQRRVDLSNHGSIKMSKESTHMEYQAMIDRGKKREEEKEIKLSKIQDNERRSEILEAILHNRKKRLGSSDLLEAKLTADAFQKSSKTLESSIKSRPVKSISSCSKRFRDEDSIR